MHSRRKNLHHEHMPSEKNDALIESINSSNLGWKADNCKLQKSHKNHCKDDEVNLAQVSDEKPRETFGQGKGWSKALEKAQKYQQKYSSYDQIPDDELPASFDWRNVDNYDFTGEIRDQGACVSCYTVAFT